MSVGAYAALAHAAIDELVARTAPPSSAAARGSTCAPPSPTSRVPPAPAAGARERWEPSLRRRPGRRARAAARARPRAAAAVHANDRRRVVRALELAEAGRVLVPADDRLWAAGTRHPTLIVGLDVPADELERRIVERTDAMFAPGVVDEVRAALAGGVSRRPRRRSACSEIATLARDGGARARSSSGPAATPPTSASGCAGSPASSAFDATRAPDEVADAILEVARQARQQLPRRRAPTSRAALTPERVRRLCDSGDDRHRLRRRARGGRRVGAGGDRDLESRRLGAEMSGNGTRIAARWLAAETGRRRGDDRDGGARGRRDHAGRDLRIDARMDVGEVTVGTPETARRRGAE